MSLNLTPSDLVVNASNAEKTASDMVMVFRNDRLGGHFSIMQGEVRPRELLAFHTHVNEDQHMYIIEGELHFEVGGNDGIRFTAGAGDHVLKPRGSSHGFWNLGDTTVRYVETSTEGGFERFVDGRQNGLAAMVGDATAKLGMSFETKRAMEVMKEFDLINLAGANMDLQELIRDPNFHKLMREDAETRDFFLYMGGAKLKEAIRGLL
jgi:mannose-6-phosphate isomerase-like protein (cupin superfamily)